MKREELRQWFVEWLDDYYDELYSEDDLTPEVAESVLTALRPVSREQVERMRGEWRECFEDWREQIAGDQCSKCGFQHYGTSINHYKFCPACGAPMTDEAVEMVMERMEKLHENIHND